MIMGAVGAGMIAMVMAIVIVITIQIMATTDVVVIAGRWKIREPGSRPSDDVLEY
ncbi:hypothetical protein W822_15445 [Advenella kashmirensis W13003]|uniref:Uncharacterized protein n=1 Tax=Advenella kashmirensis W13003 TaxID=1424334 RepID=V8QR07_9BURK|nr:hypothetical protein W822_15445 [Advenella kashmirensis W13003]